MGERLLFVNGTILTMDRSRPRAEALLVDGARIAAVGFQEELQEGAGNARVIDLNGATLIPGFNDSHCHILSFGINLGRLDVSPERVSSLEEIGRLVGERAAGDEGWILGRGYNQNLLREGRHPTRHDLDAVCSGKPVVLWHTSGHVLTANSRALQLAGISASTETPPGGEIEREGNGSPTGVLKEAPAMNLLGRVIPPPARAESVEAIRRAMRAMAEQGVTSASDAATGGDDSLEDDLVLYREAVAGERVGRITLMPEIVHIAPPGSDTIVVPGAVDVGSEPDWLRVGPVKIFSDGAMSTYTAAVREPYEGTDLRGILIWDRETLQDMVTRANRARWQIAIHAIGDEAIEEVLAAYEVALRDRPRQDHRHRIEHCMMADAELATRMRDLGVIPSLQPDIFRLGDGYIAALGIDRASRVIPVGLFRNLGVPVAFSSDRPVVPGDPLECVRDAVERRTPSGVVLGPEHCVSLESALWSYTAGGAFATHTDAELGQLRPGMLADLAVLRGNLEDPASLKVTMTVTGGQIVYGD